LAFAMKDESPLVRRSAVRAIEGQRGDAQMQGLMLALTDEDNEVRRLAAEALGMSGDCQALTALELALRDEDLWVRAAAVRALGHFDGKDVKPLIEKGLGDSVGWYVLPHWKPWRRPIRTMPTSRWFRRLITRTKRSSMPRSNCLLSWAGMSGWRNRLKNF
ncbi:MAG TPA: HEAT repeat domain-containing protein, partial [Desulfuromonadales bacterium]|nr:HEAT repeat domain-containing protein [Desulfuromonadales bacterium]